MKVSAERVLLLRLDSATLSAWEKAPFEIKGLLKHFAGSLPDAPVFIARERESQVVSDLISLFKDQPSIIDFDNEAALVRELFEQSDIAFVFLFSSLFPLYDYTLGEKLYEIHSQYAAEVSYVENAPHGIAPLIVDKTFIEILDEEKLDPGNTPLRTFVEKHVNQFQVEIHFEDPDFRILRLDFACRDQRSLEKTRRFAEHFQEKSPVYAELFPLIEKNPELIYTHPSYLEFELTGACELSCTFCPRTIAKPEPVHASTEVLQSLYKLIENSPDPVTVALGGLGEPLEHPEAVKIILEILNKENVQLLVLETNGIHLKKLDELLTSEQLYKLVVIANLNSLENYPMLHGADKKDEVFAAFTHWKEAIDTLDPEKRPATHLQALKILENEEEIDPLFNFSEEHGFEFLLQKYNSYAGAMEEKRVSDMTPLERSPCWHLRRDLFIRSDGTVPFCKQDVKSEKSRGNLVSDGFEKIWQNQQKDWIENYQQNYGELCSHCDEYFTFNM